MSEADSIKPSRICSFPGCNRPCAAKGLCHAHWKQQLRGVTLQPIRVVKYGPICEFPGCGRKHESKGYCKMHSEQRRRGKPLTSIYSTRRHGSTPPRIICDESMCPRQDLIGPCHVFRGCTNGQGYGVISLNRKATRVHRYIWERENGPIPEGTEIDHQCRNRAYCNVDHLRCVTRQVNSTENVVGMCWQIMAAKTHCPVGHPYDAANTVRNNKGSRECRMCISNRRLLYRLRMKVTDKQKAS